MKISRLLTGLLVSLCFISVTVSALGAPEPEITFSSTKIRPGDYFQIRIKAADDSKVTIRFLEDLKQVYPLGNSEGFFGLVAASYRTKPGTYPLVIEISNEYGVFLKEQTIEVSEYNFREERIKIPEQQRQAILTPDNRASDTTNTTQVRNTAQKEHLPPLWDGVFVWPVKGRISAEFGLIRYVNDLENGRHSGWDIAAPSGTPVIAANHGRVVLAKYLHLTGNTIIVHHGMDLFSSYSHLSTLNAKQGEQLSKGQLIGRVGMTGLATGPHLHLTFWVGEIPINPGLILGQAINYHHDKI